MRFYNPQLSEYQSTFVPLPLDYLNKNLQETQAKSDSNRDLADQMDLLFAKPVLDQDLAGRNQLIKEHQGRVEEAISSAQGDYSKLTPFLRDEYKRINNELTMGKLGSMYGNYNSYIEYKKGLDEQLKKGADGGITPDTYKVMLDSAKKAYQGVGEGDETGRYNTFQGNQVMADMDLTQEGFKFFEGWKADAISNGQVRSTPDGNYFMKTKSGWEKVDENELYQEGLKYFQTTPKYREYAQQRAFVDTYGLPDQIEDTEYKEQVNPKTGKKEYVPVSKQYSKEEYQKKYQEDLFKQASQAGAKKYGYVTQEYDQDIEADPFALKKYENNLNNPAPLLLGKEAEALKLGTTLDNTESIQSNLTGSEIQLREEFKQLLIAGGTNEVDAASISKYLSVEDINRNVEQGRNNKYAGLTGKFDGIYSSYNNTTLLNKEADTYASKIAPKTGKLKELTPEDEKLFLGTKDSNLTTLDDNGNLVDNPAHTTAVNLAKKYGYATIGDMERAYNTDVQKYNNAKNQYLQDNAQQRLKQNIVLNQNVLLTTDTNGNVIVDTDNTNAINKQIDTYFEKGNYNDVVTTIQKDDGSFYTLGEYRQVVAAEQGVTIDKVKINKPWYSQYSESSTDVNGKTTTIKPMYVEVGGTAVKINQDQLYVNTGQGLTPLSQMNNTPQNATENWLANTASYGVREKPVDVGGGNNIVVKNAKTTNNYANGSDLQVIYYNPDGTVRGTLTGPKAFNYLTTLQEQGKLK